MVFSRNFDFFFLPAEVISIFPPQVGLTISDDHVAVWSAGYDKSTMNPLCLQNIICDR